jgi:hypothetical protein
VKCRHCDAELRLPFVDLGTAPASNTYLTREQVRMPEGRSLWFDARLGPALALIEDTAEAVARAGAIDLRAPLA